MKLYDEKTAKMLWEQGKMPEEFFAMYYRTPEENWRASRSKVEKMLSDKRTEEKLQKTVELALEKILKEIKL